MNDLEPQEPAASIEADDMCGTNSGTNRWRRRGGTFLARDRYDPAGTMCRYVMRQSMPHLRLNFAAGFTLHSLMTPRFLLTGCLLFSSVCRRGRSETPSFP